MHENFFVEFIRYVPSKRSRGNGLLIAMHEYCVQVLDPEYDDNIAEKAYASA